MVFPHITQIPYVNHLKNLKYVKKIAQFRRSQCSSQTCLKRRPSPKSLHRKHCWLGHSLPFLPTIPLNFPPTQTSKPRLFKRSFSRLSRLIPFPPFCKRNPQIKGLISQTLIKLKTE